jgi:peptidylprolyl isomerase
MKRISIILFVAALTAAASAQTTASNQTTTKSTSASTTATKTPASATTTTKPSTAATSASTTTPPWIKLPPGVPRVVHGPLQTSIALHYEDIKVGTGAAAESGKLWHIKYTGWRAADGVKFDSWDEHTQPVIGKDGKPELGPDGKPKMGDPQPLPVPQGIGRVIPGFDYGLTGMKIGGKRRIFIPWQLAYGTRSIPDRPDHPGIPAKSDLIFDVELVEVTDMPAPQPRPVMPGGGGIQGHPANGAPPRPGAPGATGAAPAASVPPAASTTTSAAPATTTAAPAAKPVVPTPPQPATSAPAAAVPTQPATPPASSAQAQPSTAPQPK